MVDIDFCLSSYFAFRFIWKDGVDFAEGFQHKYFRPVDDTDRISVRTPEDIDREIRKQFDELYAKYDHIGILLSGGMDSGSLASYLKPGSHAYTFNSVSGVFDADLERAEAYCRKFQLKHHLVDISMEDYEKYTPVVMRHKFAPVHSIEPQIYKAAEHAKEDGVQLMVVGESADLVFGGMDRLIIPEWTFDAFVKHFTFLDPKLVLTHPVDQSEVYEKYRRGENGIDVFKFIDEVFSIESSSSYMNAFGAAWLPYYDPYVRLMMADPLEMSRIRNGEPKYLMRSFFAMKYPEMEIPFKIAMPRPVDSVFKDWAGPTRPEFRKDIPMETLTGNQKWQLWCAEKFLEMIV